MLTGIYQIVCKTTGKRYIGSTWAKGGFHSRWARHLEDLQIGKHSSPHFQNAWNKYGANNFHWGILNIIEGKAECLKMEQIYFDTCERETLFNAKLFAVGGNGGANKGKPSANKGKPSPNKGKKLAPRSQLHKDNLRASKIGVSQSQAHIAASIEGNRIAREKRKQKENN
jgi:group I intron endonuclease